MEYSLKQKITIGKRLKDIRNEYESELGGKLNQAEFGKLLGIDGSEKEIQAKISKWETGRINAPMEYIGIYSKIGGKTLDYILAPSDATESTFKGEGKLPHHSGVRLKDGDSRKGSVEVGVYAFAGAGGPMELFEHEPIQTIDIPQHWIKPELQAVLIRGRSMEPSIIDGAVVGVDTQDKKVISGELYAVWLEYEGAVVKRLFIEQNIVRVSSDNPAFKEMQIKNDEINTDTFVLGKVCWLMQSY